MKRILIIALVASAVMADAQVSTISASDVGGLEWLLGQWIRSNPKPGRTGVELWSKGSTTELVGRGILLQGRDTIFVEKMRIFVKDGGLYYAADVPVNKSEILFGVVSVTKSGFICENPLHDFPKRIEYRMEGEVLHATISGDGKEIRYVFRR